MEADEETMEQLQAVREGRCGASGETFNPLRRPLRRPLASRFAHLDLFDITSPPCNFLQKILELEINNEMFNRDRLNQKQVACALSFPKGESELT